MLVMPIVNGSWYNSDIIREFMLREKKIESQN